MGLDMNERMRLDELIEAAQAQPSLLTNFERDFIQSQIEAREKYGDNMRLSEKQWAVLDKIALKLAL